MSRNFSLAEENIHANNAAVPYSKLRNSSLVRPASAMISINKPFPIGSCLGTEMRNPSLFRRIMWLPDCLTGAKPIFLRALRTSLHDKLGSLEDLGNYTVTFTSLALFCLASASTSSRYSLIASWMFLSASAFVLPSLRQPGSSIHFATNPSPRWRFSDT